MNCYARLWKEYNMYRKEAEEQKVKVDKMIADAGDEYEIRNAVRKASFLQFWLEQELKREPLYPPRPTMS